MPILPFIDDNSSTSSMSSRLVGIDEPNSCFVYSMGMLALFSFLSLGGSHSRLHPHVLRAASLFSVVHFIVYDNPRAINISCLIVMVDGSYRITIVSDIDLDSDTESCSDSNLSSL